MKEWIRPMTAEQAVRKYPVSGLVPGWFFRVDEVSFGCYVVEGTDLFGRTVSRSGVDVDELKTLAAQDAQQIKSQTLMTDSD